MQQVAHLIWKLRVTALVAALLLCREPAYADAPTMLAFGAGVMESCADWTSSTANDAEFENWILGYWTGLNRLNADNHHVGATTDALGIIGEIRFQCEKTPSEKPMDATLDVYSKMSATHR